MIRSIQKTEYKEIWLQNTGTIFQDPDWINLVISDIQEVRYFGYYINDTLTNCFAAIYQKGRLFSHYTLPILTPHLGWVIPNLQDDLIVETLRKDKAATLHYSTPMDNGSWRSLPSYEIDLRKDASILFSNLRNDKQRSIKKAEKVNLRIDFEKDHSRLIRLLKKTFERQDKNFQGYAQIDNIVQHYANCFQVNISADDQELSSLLFVYSARKCYYLIGGFNTTAENNFAGPYGMWNSILHAKELGIETFDFEGSSIPSIANYFESFGSEKTSYSTHTEQRLIYKTLSRFL